MDPADRITLDDEVQLALALVLDRLTPPERTAFVLHDVFGFPFDAVGDLVGRTPAACRQLASRARARVQTGKPPGRSDVEITRQRVLAERFIAACAGGDISDLLRPLTRTSSAKQRWKATGHSSASRVATRSPSGSSICSAPTPAGS